MNTADTNELARSAARVRRHLADAERARHELGERVRAALAAGMSITEVANVTGLQRLQVRRFRDAAR